MSEKAVRGGSEWMRVYADLLHWGPTTEVQSRMRTMPRFMGLLESIDPTHSDDELAAAHESVFGFNVFPFASVFLEVDGRLGQEITQGVRRFASLKGIDVDPLGDAPDHICTELRILEQLENEPGLSARCLDEILLPWIPAFVCAVRDDGSAYYAQAVQQLLDDLLELRTTLPQYSDDVSVEPCSSKPAPHILDLEDSDTSVHDISDYLTSPSSSGLFLSRAQISGAAKSSRLPSGFGRRNQMMSTVLRSAAAYDSLGSFGESISAIIEHNRSVWQLVADKEPSSAAKEWALDWLARLERTEKMLAKLSSAKLEQSAEDA